MTHDRLIAALVQSKNEAADDALLEALRLGNEPEQAVALDALFQRKTVHGLSGVIGQFEELPEPRQAEILGNIKLLHHALRAAGRSERTELRLAAMRLIALGRQGKLAYVLSENLHEPEEARSKAAVEALVALARWVATETRKLQKGVGMSEYDSDTPAPPHTDTLSCTYFELLDQRPEIEQAVARAIDGHRGTHGTDLLRAALLLCDWPGSKTLAILNTAKHGGQSPMVRRLQQPPASEQVDAFLLGASHGGLRSHFGIAFSHIEEAPVLDALLRKTHWLKDHALQNCVHFVTRGTWWNDGELIRDVSRRDPGDAARIGEWLAVSGVHDVVQDERMDRLRTHAADDFGARLRLLRIAARRKRGTSVQFIKALLTDSDERIARMAAREIVRRRPVDFENVLLQQMTTAPDSVRRIIGRVVGQSGFDQFWTKFDRLDRSTRKQAGRAMLKLLPDAVQRLSRRLLAGAPEQRLKAMQIVQELKLADAVQDQLLKLCDDPHPRLRSKAVSVLGEIPLVAPDPLIERLLVDTDPRVRANTIEVLESRHRGEFLPILIQRARVGSNRERANAIKVMHRLKVSTFGAALQGMLQDPRPEHRISAMWALRQTGWWHMIGEVGRMAKGDDNLRVRRYALTVLKAVSEMVREQRAKKAG
ncbi:MAG TPA: HEAT repeat domain-containing protein [Tepidisphaeraceae bacterium]|nr:HEAT repeat domain-containing protein [Tepidisphaeraceae bacterium]